MYHKTVARMDNVKDVKLSFKDAWEEIITDHHKQCISK